VITIEQEKLENWLGLCRLLLDENRLRLVGVLAEQAVSVPELAARLKLKEPLVVRHLGQLAEAGLAQKDEAGRYYLDLKQLQALKKEFFSLTQPSSEPENETEKILARFVKDGQLSHLPVDRSKLLLVLEWAVGKFEMGVNYPEREVNEIISQFHPDYATMRRMLIDYNFMQREKGIYWRV
jgi:hypothetical protein